MGRLGRHVCLLLALYNVPQEPLDQTLVLFGGLVSCKLLPLSLLISSFPVSRQASLSTLLIMSCGNTAPPGHLQIKGTGINAQKELHFLLKGTRNILGGNLHKLCFLFSLLSVANAYHKLLLDRIEIVLQEPCKFHTAKDFPRGLLTALPALPF